MFNSETCFEELLIEFIEHYLVFINIIEAKYLLTESMTHKKLQEKEERKNLIRILLKRKTKQKALFTKHNKVG